MSAPRAHPSARTFFLAWPALLFVAWIAAWRVDLALRARLHWDAPTDTIYWVAMKALLWVLPVLVAIRVLERARLADFLALRGVARGVRWALGVGAVLVAVTFVGRTWPGGLVWRRPDWSLMFLNAVVVAPIVEEMALRGYALTRLSLNGHRFWTANVLSTLLFVAMHLPGWLFNGRVTSLATFLPPLIPLALLSLLFGWVKMRSDSLYASMLLHGINNLYSSLFP
jgi:membrane protease YdiL (CAAX protease family)